MFEVNGLPVLLAGAYLLYVFLSVVRSAFLRALVTSMND
jgi:hypothetical protein